MGASVKSLAILALAIISVIPPISPGVVLAQTRSGVCLTGAGQYQIEMGIAALAWCQIGSDTFTQLYKAISNNDSNAVTYLTTISDDLANSMAVEIKSLKVAPVTAAQKRLSADLQRDFVALHAMNSALRDVANGGDSTAATATIKAYTVIAMRVNADIKAIEH